MSDLLTSTRLSKHRTCRRQEYIRYELGVTREVKEAPLRMGGAFALGKELWRRGMDPYEAIAKATESYQERPAVVDPFDWEVERETVGTLLAGYFWRYGDDAGIEIVEAESTFHFGLVNPVTRRQSRTFDLAGKIDAIVRLDDGRLAVLEDKLTGSSIDKDDYWTRLRYDPQITLYILGARALGYDAETVLYDVSRKPTIRPRQNEDANAYAKRLAGDIKKRPDYYFQRREIPRLESDLDEFLAEVWHQGREIAEARKRAGQAPNAAAAWPRNVARTTCCYCDFSGPCLNGVVLDPNNLPAGFVNTEQHPELRNIT